MIYSGEIDYEKLYKDALERAKKIDIDEAYASQGTIAKTIFPELAESEDERIRKGLIEALKTSKTVGELKFTLPEPTREECITYLEKQKEQKPHYTKRNALFDKCVENCDPEVMKEVSDNIDEMLQKEQHPSSRFLPGDWVVYDGPLGHAILQIEDVIDGRYTFVDNDSTLLEEDSDKFLRPLTPKDVEKPAEWSEEDVDMLNSCISSIEEAKENRYAYKETDGDTSYDHEIAWLKSLRPRWKPSEEQMSMLLAVINDPNNAGAESCYMALKSIYNNLKKL